MLSIFVDDKRAENELRYNLYFLNMQIKILDFNNNVLHNCIHRA